MASDDPTELGITRLGQKHPVVDDGTRLAGAELPGAVPLPHLSAPNGPLTTGQRFGRYTIGRLLGMGGMGAVYQARDEELEIIVALKVIRPEALRDASAAQSIERRFKRELLLARKVTHGNVVRIHDIGEIDGIKYITMSYVEGTDLATLVKTEGPLPIRRIMRIMASVVSGLLAAHKAGVVHCDLKPSNIMVAADGEAMIMDFGISRSSGNDPAQVLKIPSSGSNGEPALELVRGYTAATVSGAIFGTLDYMAPEQARGAAVDHRADIFAAGLIAYDLLTNGGRTGLEGSSTQVLQERINGQLPALKSIAPHVPDALAAVVTRATHTDAGERFQTTEELAEALAGLDDRGMPRPVRRVVGLRLVTAGLIALIGIAWVVWSNVGAVRPLPAAVTIVIADIENRTSDPAFDLKLEPTIRRALEGAGFVAAFDRLGLRRTVGAVLPEKLDEAAARELALKHGLRIVLSSSIARQGNGFEVSMKATEVETGKVAADSRALAASPDQVILAAVTLVRTVRSALGDRTTETDPIFDSNGPLAKPVGIVRLYGAAIEAISNNKLDDARQLLSKLNELDPTFGPGYLTLVTLLRNQSQNAEVQTYLQVALGGMDSMTDRERIMTRGMQSRMNGDYRQCARDNAELVSRYPADVIGHNQLALCSSLLRDFTRAREEMRKIVKLLPERTIFLDNLSLYSNYAGDFASGETEARTVINLAPDAYGFLSLAMSLSAQGRIDEALATYRMLASVPGIGPTISAAGLGDLAIYEGRFIDAVRILEDGARADLAEKNPQRAAEKYAAQAFAHLQRGQKAAAVASADKALRTSQSITVQFLAARVYVESGQVGKARPLAEGFAANMPDTQTYARIIQGLIATADSDFRKAIRLLSEANALINTWIGHYDLGRAYIAAGQYQQADSEFRICLDRRGEALSLFVDEEPTFGYFPLVYYQLGRAGQEIGAGDYAERYRAYLGIREKAGEDPLLADVRARLK